MELNDNEDDGAIDFHFPMSKYDQRKRKDFESNIRSILEDDEDSVGNKGSI